MSDHGWVVKCWIGEREIKKHTTNSADARKIAKKLREAATVLGLLDIFRCDVYESEY